MVLSRVAFSFPSPPSFTIYIPPSHFLVTTPLLWRSIALIGRNIKRLQFLDAGKRETKKQVCILQTPQCGGKTQGASTMSLGVDMTSP